MPRPAHFRPSSAPVVGRKPPRSIGGSVRSHLKDAQSIGQHATRLRSEVASAGKNANATSWLQQRKRWEKQKQLQSVPENRHARPTTAGPVLSTRPSPVPARKKLNRNDGAESHGVIGASRRVRALPPSVHQRKGSDDRTQSWSRSSSRSRSRSHSRNVSSSHSRNASSSHSRNSSASSNQIAPPITGSNVSNQQSRATKQVAMAPVTEQRVARPRSNSSPSRGTTDMPQSPRRAVTGVGHVKWQPKANGRASHVQDPYAPAESKTPGVHGTEVPETESKLPRTKRVAPTPESKQDSSSVRTGRGHRVNIVAIAVEEHLPEDAKAIRTAVDKVKPPRFGVHSASWSDWVSGITHTKDKHHVEKLRSRIQQLHRDAGTLHGVRPRSGSTSRPRSGSASRPRSGSTSSNGEQKVQNARNNGTAVVADPTYDSLSSIHFYSVSTLIGEGAFGKVWSGRHRFAQATVAIKSFEKSKIKDRQAWFRIKREARLLKKLNHPVRR